MAIFEIQLSDGTIDKVSIPGSEDLSSQQLSELLHWSKENSEKRALVTAQKKRYKTIPAIQAYQHMKAFQRRLAGHGKVF